MATTRHESSQQHSSTRSISSSNLLQAPQDWTRTRSPIPDVEASVADFFNFSLTGLFWDLPQEAKTCPKLCLETCPDWEVLFLEPSSCLNSDSGTCSLPFSFCFLHVSTLIWDPFSLPFRMYHPVLTLSWAPFTRPLWRREP